MDRKARPQTELTALAITPDRELALQFASTLSTTRAFHILAELKAYPPLQTLDIRLRQLRPDIVFIDLATDLEQAAQIIEFVAQMRPPVFVVGLHRENSPEAILRSLRAGATEFLHAPFEIEMQREAIGRISRLRAPQSRSEVERGKLLAFTYSKPGSGATTLACQTAFAVKRLSAKRVLLADFDLSNGSIGFFFKVSHWYSLVDALQQLSSADDTDWASLVVNTDGVDILPAPETPATLPADPERLHDLLEYTRGIYDYIVIDLPSVFERLSLITLSDSDDAFLVCTADLPSMHLTRKAVSYLTHIGFGQERYRVLVNRLGKQDSISGEDMGKIFGAPVAKTFPNDYLALHKGLTVGQPLGPKTPLGRSVEEFAGTLAARAAESKRVSTVVS